MIKTAECPTREELIRLTHGDLPGDQLESVCDHVEACEKCQLILGQLDDPPDEFAKQLAQITPEALENARLAIEAETLMEMATSIWGRFSPVLESRERKPTLTVPCQLGQYEVLRLIAHGGMGEVYEGRHVRLKRPVAVKVIRGFRQDDPVSHDHFLREMETAGQLEHPNLVRAYDAWEHDGYLFLAQELLDGDSLQTLAHKGQIKTPDEIVAALLGTCRALDQLHGKGFVHRDVKPANIMRLTDGTIKVIDYGLAVAADSGKSAGRVGAGTVGYMSPEQANGSGTVDNRSDIYSAGRVLKYLLSKLPEVFADAKDAELVQKLTALAERLTQRDPNGRLQSVYAVIVQLEQLEQLQQPAVPIETPPEVEAPPKVPPTPLVKRTPKTKRATSRKRTAAAPATETPTKPHRRGNGWLVMLALIIAAIGFGVFQIIFKTDRPTTVMVQNHQPGDVINITSEDGKVRSVELGDQPKFVVDPGTYELSLEGPDNRRLNPANITVTGLAQITVRIEDRPVVVDDVEPIEVESVAKPINAERSDDVAEKATDRAVTNDGPSSSVKMPSVPTAPAKIEVPTPAQQTENLQRPSLQMLPELVAESTSSIAISSDGKTVYWDRNGKIWSAMRDDLTPAATFQDVREVIEGRHFTLDGDTGVLLVKRPDRNSETLHEFMLKNGNPSRPKEISTLVPDSGRVFSPHLSSGGDMLCFAGRINGPLPQLFYSKRSTSGNWTIALPLLRDSKLTDGWTWPSLLDDGKVLLTTNQNPVLRDDESRYPHNIFIARRTSANAPFTRTELVDLPGMKSLWFQSPRYLPATGELFVLVQPRSEAGTPTWKPAVIRGVRLDER